MGSHRRFVSSGAEEPYLLPMQSYGGWFDFTTNIREEQKAGGTIRGWLDSLIGGFEEEDIKASSTVGGIDPRTGKPVAPDAARYPADLMTKPPGGGGAGGGGGVPCSEYPSWLPAFVKQDILGCETRKPDPKRLAVVASVVLAGGIVLYAAPKIIARYQK